MSDWMHLVNPFANATATSKRKMLILITDHTSALQAINEPLEVSMFNRTLPLKEDFTSKYSQWSAARARWRGETTRLKQKIAVLRGDKIVAWDLEIQQVFRHQTAEYAALLPNRRKPFQVGAYDIIINNIQSLSLALEEHTDKPTLVTLKGDVDTFYNEILEIRGVQQQSETKNKLAAKALEKGRLVCADMLFKNLGLLIDAYSNQTKKAANYFQLDLVRDRRDKSKEYEGLLAPAEEKNVLKGGFNSKSRLLINNTGEADIECCIADKPKIFTEQTFTVKIGKQADTDKLAGGMPNLTGYFLNIRNKSEHAIAGYLVVVQ